MRAAVYSRVGPAREVLDIVERERPQPGPGEVLVRVMASGVNPTDVKSRAGLRTKVLPFAEITPHSDGAGVIEAVGKDVALARIGERVWVCNAAYGRAQGTAADFVALPETFAMPLPADVSFDAGACLGIPALTACHAVLGYGGVLGKRVLVAGGAGAVGNYAVQMARLAGAAQVVATVSSAAKAELARAAGAADTIDRRSDDIAVRAAALTGGHGFDRIIEVDFGANIATDLEIAAADAQIVVYGSGLPEIQVPFFASIRKNLQYLYFMVFGLSPADRTRATAQLDAWLAAGALRHNVALRLPLERVAEAHEAVETGRLMGNVVLATGG